MNFNEFINIREKMQNNFRTSKICCKCGRTLTAYERFYFLLDYTHPLGTQFVCPSCAKKEFNKMLEEMNDRDTIAMIHSNNWRKLHGYPMRRKRK